MNYRIAPVNPEAALKLIARVPTGRKVLENFITLYRAGHVTLEPYEPALLDRLRAALGEGQPVGACFINDGQSGTIHFDPAAPLGVLAPFLLHEMVHATDSSLWRAPGTSLTRKSMDRLMLEAETRAFELQHRFVQELRKADPDFDQFLAQEQSRVRVLHEKLTEQDIAELYGFEH